MRKVNVGSCNREITAMLSSTLGQFELAPGFWSHVGDLAEKRGEVTLVLKTSAQADLDQRQFSVRQELLGAFDPAFHQIVLRCQTGRLSEGAGKVKLAQTRHSG